MQAFLDLAGVWDTSLALVMAGAIAAALPLFAVARRRSTALLGGPLHLPATRRIGRRLLLGSLLFGVGWGLAGICLGPAIVLVASLVPQALLFGAAMLAGMALYEWLA